MNKSLQISVYSSVNGKTWFWEIIDTDRQSMISSRNDNGSLAGYASRETALAEACKIAYVIVSKKPIE